MGIGRNRCFPPGSAFDRLGDTPSNLISVCFTHFFHLSFDSPHETEKMPSGYASTNEIDNDFAKMEKSNTCRRYFCIGSAIVITTIDALAILRNT